ncbi:MAG: PEP-CTERM sorting domain-containing protein [Rubrivivax sp.]|nr:MAG: PEP-CTERM sorting domain-containing protein [Rubrivivax sp.]
MNISMRTVAAITCVCLISQVHAQGLVNADFENGFTGWTVGPHDPTSAGQPRGAAPFVGNYLTNPDQSVPVFSHGAIFQPGDFQSDTISQTIVTQAGDLGISGDFAMWSTPPLGSPSQEWVPSGMIRVFLDGQQLQTPSGWFYESADASFNVADHPLLGVFHFYLAHVDAGSHELTIAVDRYGIQSSPDSPRTALDNIRLSGVAAVPEPSTSLMAMLGILAGAAHWRRRRHQATR